MESQLSLLADLGRRFLKDSGARVWVGSLIFALGGLANAQTLNLTPTLIPLLTPTATLSINLSPSPTLVILPTATSTPTPTPTLSISISPLPTLVVLPTATPTPKHPGGDAHNGAASTRPTIAGASSPDSGSRCPDLATTSITCDGSTSPGCCRKATPSHTR